MTTVTTDKSAGIALPVEEQQNASPTTDRQLDCPNERLAQHRSTSMIA
jgi:hypothetical protein